MIVSTQASGALFQFAAANDGENEWRPIWARTNKMHQTRTNTGIGAFFRTEYSYQQKIGCNP